VTVVASLRGIGRVWNNRPGVVDAATAVVAIGAGIGSLLVQMRVEELGGEPGSIPRWAAIVWTVVVHVPLAWRRTRPVAAGIVLGLIFCGFRLWEVPEYTVSAIALFVTFVSIGRYGRRGRDATRIGITLGLAAVLAAGIIFQETPEEFRPVLTGALTINLLYNIVFVGAAWLLGDALRRQADRERSLEERTRQLVDEREANARRAVVDERLRIAREVHDVVAHHVSLMGVQAGAARRMVGRDPERVPQMLSTVEDSSRQAVDELRRLIGLLRSDEDRRGLLEPFPGIDRLEQLVADTRATGLDVRLAVDGDPCPLPDSVSLSAYRIVQEALTNTIKHAHARRCEVAVRYGTDAIEVEVTDDGIGARTATGSGASADATVAGVGTGHGVAGMGERVALHDGELSVGPLADGGYGVRARFPLRGAA